MARLIPMLPVRSMPAAVEFYGKLGFTVENRNESWGWAMLRFDDCRLMVDQSINQHPGPARDGVIYLYPDDLSAYHAMLRHNGVDVPEFDFTFYGHREFRLDDPDGNRLWIYGHEGERPRFRPDAQLSARHRHRFPFLRRVRLHRLLPGAETGARWTAQDRRQRAPGGA